MYSVQLLNKYTFDYELSKENRKFFILMNLKKKRVMVDLSATLIHHGHIRILKKASKYGNVFVALTSDNEVKKNKGYVPELNFNQRKEILSSIKYVYKVLKSKWAITTDYLRKNKIDIFVRGSDYRNQKIFQNTIFHQRTKGISSSLIRKKILSRRKN